MGEERRKSSVEALSADVPTYYTNSMSVGISPYDVSVVFGVQTAESARTDVRIMMSLEHAVVMTMVLRRVLRENASRTGITPKVPDTIMRDMQLDEEETLW